MNKRSSISRRRKSRVISKGIRGVESKTYNDESNLYCGMRIEQNVIKDILSMPECKLMKHYN